MILTCPSCHTKYVVKDGAIPPGGRQVRCANCKESWHQMPEGEEAAPAPVETAPPALEEAPQAAAYAAPPEEVSVEEQRLGDDVMASDDAGIAGEPVPEAVDDYPVSEEPAEDIAHQDVSGPPVAEDVATAAYASDEAHYEPIDDEAPAYDEPAVVADEDFAVHIPDEDEPRGKGKLWLGLIVLLAIAAAAAWFFAPASLKEKIGLAGGGKSPLELMVTTSDRQQLASGNELLAISGRVINPTAEEQAVPPIRAELRNKASKKVVYQWTIAPPARSLPPGGSASFNSAEVDIPPGGDELTVTLANAAG